MRWSGDNSMWGNGAQAFRIVVLCAFVFLALPACREHMAQPTSMAPSPPDLSHCTRIEIAYFPSTLKYFFPGASVQWLFSPEERGCLESLKKIVVHDRETIRRFAQDVGAAEYQGPNNRSYGIANAAHVICYREDEQLTSFIMIGGSIQTQDGHEFQFRTNGTNWQAIHPRISQLQMRLDCAGNLRSLRRHLPQYFQGKKPYPASPEWCDVIVRDLRSRYGSAKNRVEFLMCPSVREGKCHYAMNPNCKPNSPLDTVLFFETKAGWNQHGGPELFTFDNHDPKGGCVLLNDGTVKFIRTKEELQQLRWK